MKTPTTLWQRFQLRHRLEVDFVRLEKWLAKQPEKWWEGYPFSPFELIATQSIQGDALEFVCRTLPVSELSRPNEEGLSPIQVGLEKLSYQKDRRDFERQLAFVHQLLLLGPSSHSQDMKYLCKVIHRNIKNEETIGQMGASSQSYERMYVRLLKWGSSPMEESDFPLLHKALKQYWVNPFQFRETILKGFKPKPLLKPALDGLWLLKQFNESLLNKQESTFLSSSGSTFEALPTWLKELPKHMHSNLISDRFSFHENENNAEQLRSESKKTQIFFDRCRLSQAIPKESIPKKNMPQKKRL